MKNMTNLTPTPPVVMHLLSQGYLAEETFYNEVRLQVMEAIDFFLECDDLNGSETFTVENFCGDVFWDELSKKEHMLAGRCVVSMVNANLLPLVHVGTNSKNSRLYKLK